jgi:hypothetical protein
MAPALSNLNNSELFINIYLKKISERFSITLDDAFEILAIAAILDRPFDEVFSNIIVQGKEDGGIDGIYFEGDNGDYSMHVFQCKNSKSSKQNEINKFRNDYREVFIDGNKLRKHNITGLATKLKEYEKLISSGMVIQPKLYFLYNGTKNDSKFNQNATLHSTYHVAGEF